MGRRSWQAHHNKLPGPNRSSYFRAGQADSEGAIRNLDVFENLGTQMEHSGFLMEKEDDSKMDRASFILRTGTSGTPGRVE